MRLLVTCKLFHIHSVNSAFLSETKIILMTCRIFLTRNLLSCHLTIQVIIANCSNFLRNLEYEILKRLGAIVQNYFILCFTVCVRKVSGSFGLLSCKVKSADLSHPYFLRRGQLNLFCTSMSFKINIKIDSALTIHAFGS